MVNRESSCVPRRWSRSNYVDRIRRDNRERQTLKDRLVSSITSALPMEKLMFEAAEPAVFQYYVQNFGADVNVFIDHSQIVQLACVRKGIWGKSDLFNRVVTFKDDYYADESRGLEASCAFALLH